MVMIGGVLHIRWSDEDKELLRKACKDKLSFRQTSELVFKGKYSRSAVASQARNLRLSFGTTSKRTERSVIRRAVPRVSVMAVGAKLALSKLPTPPIFFDEDKPIGDGPYSILELTHSMCRWPVEGGFCGAHVDQGSYCAPHKRKNLRSV